MELSLLVGELLHRPATPEVDVVAARKDLHDQRLEVRLARLVDERLDHLVALLDEHIDRATYDAGALRDRHTGPLHLCVARLGDRELHIGLTVDDDLADRLTRCRAADPEPPAPLGSCGKCFDNGHPFAPVAARPRGL